MWELYEILPLGLSADSLLPLLWCFTILSQSPFMLKVSRNRFILSFPLISFIFHLMEVRRLGKGGHCERINSRKEKENMLPVV